MRAIVAAVLLVATHAAAQTPRDIARQVWPLGAPAAAPAAAAPRSATIFAAGSATGRDLSQLLWPHGAPRDSSVASATGAAYAQTFTPADLVRLRGDDRLAGPALEAGRPYRTALKDSAPRPFTGRRARPIW